VFLWKSKVVKSFHHHQIKYLNNLIRMSSQNEGISPGNSDDILPKAVTMDQNPIINTYSIVI